MGGRWAWSMPAFMGAQLMLMVSMSATWSVLGWRAEAGAQRGSVRLGASGGGALACADGVGTGRRGQGSGSAAADGQQASAAGIVAVVLGLAERDQCRLDLGLSNSALQWQEVVPAIGLAPPVLVVEQRQIDVG